MTAWAKEEIEMAMKASMQLEMFIMAREGRTVHIGGKRFGRWEVIG